MNQEIKNTFLKVGKKGGYLGNQKIYEVGFDVNNPNIFKEALYLGYLDVSRTISIQDKKNNYKSNVIKDIYPKLQKYFKNLDFENYDKKTFDDFHCKFCKKLIETYKNKLKYDLSYGQAQKIINMAFKYLYCCNNLGDYQKCFKYCHMPLDKYTLLWFGSKSGVYIFTWSKMEEALYIRIQECIREYLKNKIILEEEFKIWEKYKDNTFELEKGKDQDKVLVALKAEDCSL